MTLLGPGSYVELKRTWKTGDSVSLVLPKTLRIEGLADNESARGFDVGAVGAGR